MDRDTLMRQREIAHRERQIQRLDAELAYIEGGMDPEQFAQWSNTFKAVGMRCKLACERLAVAFLRP